MWILEFVNLLQQSPQNRREGALAYVLSHTMQFTKQGMPSYSIGNAERSVLHVATRSYFFAVATAGLGMYARLLIGETSLNGHDDEITQNMLVETVEETCHKASGAAEFHKTIFWLHFFRLKMGTVFVTTVLIKSLREKVMASAMPSLRNVGDWVLIEVIRLQTTRIWPVCHRAVSSRLVQNCGGHLA